MKKPPRRFALRLEARGLQRAHCHIGRHGWRRLPPDGGLTIAPPAFPYRPAQPGSLRGGHAIQAQVGTLVVIEIDRHPHGRPHLR